HSNGFSLVRRIYPMKEEVLSQYVEALGRTLGEEVLAPTKIYVKTVLDLVEKFDIMGIAHLTGGGFIENIPRMIPEGLSAKVNLDSYEVPAIFKMLMADAGLEKQDAYNTFNMGIGMVLAVEADKAEEIIAYINKNTTDSAVLLGEIVEGDEGVILA
ncbi:MAG: phosphoribosylformylglycinamidine cyclo-ligase, partial [Christensenellaceae bacterium]|nr:phosphoribosylformylglycinamidine cyclo-ligase [Christensenellaceae bacterium]